MTRMVDTTSHTFSATPQGPFHLAAQSRRFGGWPGLAADADAIVMAFPVEGTEHAAAVVLRQPRDEVHVGGDMRHLREPHRLHGAVTGEVHGCPPDVADRAARQALAVVSLDIDGSGWPAVGERDRFIGDLHARYGYLRPTLFHSPYEAAAAFVIGHRISIKQGRALRARIANDFGTTISIGEEQFAAFPTPEQLLQAEALPWVSTTKLERLHGIARAAQDGWLSRDSLRAAAQEQALARLQSLPGIGSFFAQGILHRGAGSIDAIIDDEITRLAIAHGYGLEPPIDGDTVQQIAGRWRPYRFWTVVLLHVWARNELGVVSKRRGHRPVRARRQSVSESPGVRQPHT